MQCIVKKKDGTYLSKYFNYNYNFEKPAIISFTHNIENARVFTSTDKAWKIILENALQSICQVVPIEIVIKELK